MDHSSEPRVTMDAVMSLCKRRGFVFPGSDIYGGLANTWDFGPLGVELRSNIKIAWWQRFVRERPDIVGLDGGILMSARVWEASGHVAEFNDPLTDCRECRVRFRADDLIEAATGTSVEGKSHAEMTSLMSAHAVCCPNCGKNSWTPVRAFNMMFRTQLGPVDETATHTYLRPETAQSIFVQYRNVLQSSRLKVPFGVAQVGKVFRNEITPGNFIFRLLEFEQLEIEYFVHPEDWEGQFEEWLEAKESFVLSLGVQPEHLRRREHAPEELSHYSRRTVDLEYRFPIGWRELTGLAYRYDFDLRRHQEASGEDLTYFDQARNERYHPHVIEPTMGVDRLMLMILCEAYDEEQTVDAKGETATRLVMRFHPRFAPYTVAVLPLSKKDELAGVAEPLFRQLCRRFSAEYDDTQSIGRRYRRQDEIGTPWCVTVDFESLSDGAVTVRDRDSMEQVRVSIGDVSGLIEARLRAAGG
ncbi:MAG TPA: glycine--tRNA ligase [Thermomicrobiales bacterium]|nr:glycine--tRNA ligase [Thermomicrobiales bacterium]